jgi:hypothetical protein
MGHSYVRYNENQTMIYEYAKYADVKIQQRRNYIHGEYVPAATTVLISCRLLQQHTTYGDRIQLRSERNRCL